MKQSVAEHLCCGCGACTEKCPVSAIAMYRDEKGFLYPCIDETKCISCGLCDGVCFFQKVGEKNSNTITAYAMRHVSEKVVKNSSSGGFFTAISDYVLKHNGHVYGAIFDAKEKNVRHTCARTSEERDLMRGSKYVQSDTVGIYSEVENDVKSGRMVLFTGTPCQCAELIEYIGECPRNLIIVDLLCHGVPSPLLFRKHIEMWEKKYGSEVFDYRFRDKMYGWEYTHKILFGNGKENHSIGLKRLLKLYDVSMRESCYACPYASQHRYGDFTVGDFWEIGKEAKIYDNKGNSVVLVNSQKGQDILSYIESECKLIPIEKNRIKQNALRKPVERSIKVDAMWDCYRNEGYEKTLDVYGKSTIKSKIYQSMLRILYIFRVDRIYKFFISKF